MRTYDVLTIIVVLSAIYSYVNVRFIKLPQTIGVMMLSLITSLLLVLFGGYVPFVHEFSLTFIKGIDFHFLLMRVMLGFLLFAGAYHIDFSYLKKFGIPVLALATIGTILSTLIIGVSLYFLFSLMQIHIGLIYCLLFGALISPTDPVAVLGILKETRISKSLEIKISGESLLNDGIGVVIFLTTLEAANIGVNNLSLWGMISLFLQEAIGGLLFGWLLAYFTIMAVRSINNYKVEILITLAIVMGGYTLANNLHVSGPLALVVAGLITGNKGKRVAMSEVSKDHITKFWELIDETLNAILFLLIGFEMLVLKPDKTIFIISLITIVIVLAARWLSVALPISILRRRMRFEKYAITLLTWGGLRGGISVALALSLPDAMYKEQFVSITYTVVVFSIIVQGLTIGKLAKRLSDK